MKYFRVKKQKARTVVGRAGGGRARCVTPDLSYTTTGREGESSTARIINGMKKQHKNGNVVLAEKISAYYNTNNEANHPSQNN